MKLHSRHFCCHEILTCQTLLHLLRRDKPIFLFDDKSLVPGASCIRTAKLASFLLAHNILSRRVGCTVKKNVAGLKIYFDDIMPDNTDEEESSRLGAFHFFRFLPFSFLSLSLFSRLFSFLPAPFIRRMASVFRFLTK